MNQSEVAKELCVSTSGLRAYSPERLKQLGFEKVGKGKGCYYRRIDDSGNNEISDMEDAIRRKTIADANLAEQKYHKERKRLFDEWSNEFYEQFADAFAPFKNKLTRLRLNRKQAMELNKVFAECMDDLDNRLQTISPAEPL